MQLIKTVTKKNMFLRNPKTILFQ